MVGPEVGEVGGPENSNSISKTLIFKYSTEREREREVYRSKRSVDSAQSIVSWSLTFTIRGFGPPCVFLLPEKQQQIK